MTVVRDEITEASGLIGLLLVFVFGYFTAVLPAALAARDTPRPEVKADIDDLVGALRRYCLVVVALLVLDVLTLAWLIPLTVETIRAITFDSGFPTIEVGLFMMVLLLASLLGTTIWLLVALLKRIAKLRS